jgi:hypothetical protein
MPTARRKQFTLAEAKTTGEKLGLSWEEFDVKQFHIGMNAELKDGAYSPNTQFASDDPIVIGKMVRTHLKEAPDYYTQWAQMEKAAAQAHSDK